MMGETAARTLLIRIEDHDDAASVIKIEPDLVVRNSTARVCPLPAAPGKRLNQKDLLRRD